MIDPLAMPVFKPLWEAFPYLPGCFAAWRGMSLGEISASAYATADGERLPSGAIVGCMAKHAARSLGNDVGDAVKRYFSRNNAVLSANLHGIDCLPEMVQAVPFFGLDRLANGGRGPSSPCCPAAAFPYRVRHTRAGCNPSTRTPRHVSRCFGALGRTPWN